MTLAEWPAEVREVLGTIQRIWEPPQGATSNVTLCDTERGIFAVKRATGTLYGSWLSREYRVLSALASAGLPVPKPHAFVRNDSGIAPERWLVIDALQGETLSAVLLRSSDPAYRHAVLHAFGQTLALVHRTASPAGLQSPKIGWLDYMLDEAGENLEHFSVDGTPELLARLRQSKPTPVPQTLIHGDYTIDNVMVEGDRITGIIDWSGGAIGDPRYDLTLATRPQREAFSAGRQADLQAFYAGYDAPPLSESDFTYFNDLYQFF